MKRITAAILIAVLLLAGCSANVKKSEISLNKNSLNASFCAESNSVEYSGTSIYDGDTLAFEIATPKELKGVKYYCSGNEIKCSYKGVDMSYTYCDLPDGFVFYDFLVALKNAGGEVFEKKNDGIYEYQNDGTTLSVDSRGNIISFKSKGTSMSFGKR